MTLVSNERRVDRSGWDPGPWDGEPDLVAFEHAGLQCVLNRNYMGGWCGYVGVPDANPAFSKDYDDVQVSVHGGLTYGGDDNPATWDKDGLWWLGFDCGHFMDLIPYIHASAKIRSRGVGLRGDMGEVYRDLAYVLKETEDLAEQLSKV